MEDQIQTTEVQQTEATQAAPETPQVSEPQAPSLDQTVQSHAQAWAPPSWKVKAYDNEYEIPEDFRGFINEKNYDKFKEVFEKHYAFDTVKQKYKDTHSKFQDVNTKYETVSKNLDRLSKFVQNGDYDSFFSAIKIPEQQILQWVHQKLQMKDLPQEQQSLYYKNSEYQRELMAREEEMEQLRKQAEEFQSFKTEMAIQQRHSQLDQALSNPEIKGLAESYDARAGKPGAFKNEVILRAAAVANATGKDLSPEEAVKEFAQLLRLSQAQQGSSGTEQVVMNNQKGSRPTIPSVAGKASSPVAKQVKSIEDLKRLAKEAQAR